MKLQEEIKTAKEKYGHFNSTHEVYGVLIEEVQEFFEVVRLPQTDAKEQIKFKTNRMIKELNQIAAIVLRAQLELSKGQIKWV